MGVFDELRCAYPLPVEGANELTFQTKDTDEQWCGLYELRADGTLWHQAYDIEDRSDPNAEGIERLIGSMTRVNKRWERDRHTGELNFYTSRKGGGWLEFAALMKGGELQALMVVSDTHSDAE